MQATDTARAGIYTNNTFNLDETSRYGLTKSLNQANAISRKLHLIIQHYTPLALFSGIIGTVAAGVFLGAPYFLAAAILTGVALTIIDNSRGKCKEDIHSIETYFENRKAYKFDNCDEERVVRKQELSMHYQTFVLEKVQQKAN